MHVALNHAAMRLRLQYREVIGMVAERLVEPRRNAAYVAHFEVLEDQVHDDVLCPSRARLVGCRDHDIAETDLEIVPAAAVQKLIIVAASGRKRLSSFADTARANVGWQASLHILGRKARSHAA